MQNMQTKRFCLASQTLKCY